MPSLYRAHRGSLNPGLIAVAILVGGCASAPAVTSARGRVVDVHGRPVSGARVTVKTHALQLVGTGVADADGHFAFALARPRGIAPELSVDADGFAHWSQWADWEQLGDCQVTLDRKVDGDYLIALRAVSDPTQRVSRMEESSPLRNGTGRSSRCSRLWASCARTCSPPARGRRERRWTISSRTAPRCCLRSGRFSRRCAARCMVGEKPLVCGATLARAGSSPRAMCSAWAAVHFEHEGVTGRWPPYSCTEAVIDPDQTRALMLFQVDYAHWRYNMHLVLRRDERKRPGSYARSPRAKRTI